MRLAAVSLGLYGYLTYFCRWALMPRDFVVCELHHGRCLRMPLWDTPAILHWVVPVERYRLLQPPGFFTSKHA